MIQHKLCVRRNQPISNSTETYRYMGFIIRGDNEQIFLIFTVQELHVLGTSKYLLGGGGGVAPVQKAIGHTSTLLAKTMIGRQFCFHSQP